MKKISLMLWATILLPIFSFAQFQVNGIVCDAETLNPLPGATVVFENTYNATISNSDGKFSIKNLKQKTYHLKISFIGYKTFEHSIHLSADTAVIVNLKHEPVMSDAVIITATRANTTTPATYSNIPLQEIKKINLAQDMPFLIQSTPSVVATSDAGAGVGYTSLRIRGTDITRINVTVNSIPLNDAESHGVWWVDLPDIASSTDNIQIQRGVGTSTNGAAAFGASINMQTSAINREPSLEITNAAGSFNTLKHSINAHSGIINNHYTFNVRLSKVSSDGYIDRASSDLKSFYISGAYHDKKNVLRINIFSGVENTYQAWNGVPSTILDSVRTYNPSGMYTDANGNTKFYENQIDYYIQSHYQLLYTRQINPKLNVNAALHYTKGFGYYESYKQNTKLSKYGLENIVIPIDSANNAVIKKTDLINRKIMNNDFYGYTFSLNYDDLKKTKISLGSSYNEYDGDHYGRIIWAQHLGNIAPNYNWYDNNGYKTDFNLYAKGSYEAIKKLQIYADVQYRRVFYRIKGIYQDLSALKQNETYNFFNPKGGLYYQITPNQSIYGSFAHAQREPSRNNFVDADSSQLPKPEKLFDFELGYKINKRVWFAAANLYYMDYTDQLVLTGKINHAGEAVMQNVDKSYRRGLELAAGVGYFYNLKLESNITLSNNKILNYADFIDNYDTYVQDSVYYGTSHISFSPEVIGNIMLTYKLHRNLHLQWNTQYVGKQYIDNTSDESRILNPYAIHNLRLQYEFKWKYLQHIASYFMLNNMFDKAYETNAWVYKYIYNGKLTKDDGYFPQAGRHFLAGVIVKL